MECHTIIKCPRLPAVLELHMEEFPMPHLMQREERDCIGKFGTARAEFAWDGSRTLFAVGGGEGAGRGGAEKNLRVVHFKWAIWFGA